MRLHELHAPKGSTHNRIRIGRGHGSGKVKTGGKGTKGQNARAGENACAPTSVCAANSRLHGRC